MSGPVRTIDVVDEAAPSSSGPTMEITPGREALVGETVVRRALPIRARRTVGAWCFLDHAPAVHVDSGGGMQVGPHPHIGLQTVTWLFAGEVLHRDSLGSEQLIRPGQLNLMTAGRGVVHAEETPAAYRGELHGVQLWVTQPENTRHGEPAFEHHGELPLVRLGPSVGTVLVGDVGGVTSRARRDTDHYGVDLALRRGSTVVPVQADHEHALVVVQGSVSIDGQHIDADTLAYLGTGRDGIVVAADADARALLLGGSPLEARPLMWWNFVARSREEVDEAYRDWQTGSDRFGPVASPLSLIPAPRPPWSTRAEPFQRRR